MLNEKNIRITTLVENGTFKRGLLAEWGLCVYIDADGKKILMDSGASPHAVTHNATALGVDLTKVDIMVLSHGHYDHTGGLTAVLQAIGKKMEIIAHPNIWDAKYVRKKDTGLYEYCGIPFKRFELERLGAKFNPTAKPTWITDNVVASGEESMTTDFESPDEALCVKKDSQFVRDPLADDQSIYIKTNLGLLVVAGCAHRGIVNVVRHACEVTGIDSIYLVVGGTHLYPASDAQLEKTIDAFKKLRIKWIGVSHCTGMKQSVRLAQEFGARFFFNNTGTVIDFPLK